MKSYMMRMVGLPLACAALAAATLACGESGPDASTATSCEFETPTFEVEAERRPFAMGFSRWPPAATQEAAERMNRFLTEHADITLIHLDNGVPWPEALAQEPFANQLQDEWHAHKAAVPADHELFVAITPLNMDRDGLARYHGTEENMPLPGTWRDRGLDHPEVRAAYLEYARRTAQFFQPDYLAIGIEVNLALLKDPPLWESYKALHRETYGALKPDFPGIQIFATFTLPHLRGEQDDADPTLQAAEIGDLTPYNDLLGLSVYPYSWAYEGDGTPPSDYFAPALAFGKPVAVTETGMPSRGFTAFFTPYEFDIQDQTNYIEFLLREAAENDFVFVVNWANIDFEDLLEHFPPGLRDLGKFWAWTGLETSEGCAKPASEIWDAYLELPRPVNE